MIPHMVVAQAPPCEALSQRLYQKISRDLMISLLAVLGATQATRSEHDVSGFGAKGASG